MKRTLKALMLCGVLAFFTGCPNTSQRGSIDTPIDETLVMAEDGR